jgi:hypothetical protein
MGVFMRSRASSFGLAGVLALTAIVAVAAPRTTAQQSSISFFELHLSPIQVGTSFTARVANAAPSTEWFLAADSQPGPRVISELQNLTIGLAGSSDFYAFPHWFTDANGDGELTFSIALDAQLAGIQCYAQAFNFDPAAPTFVTVSNVWNSVVHPATAGTGSTSTLTLFDDDTYLVSLPFTFPFYASSYTEVYVNANGNLSFGMSNLLPSGTASDFTNGVPSIAPFWTDLNPELGGSVTVDDTGTPGQAVTFTYAISDNLQGGPNTAAVTLFSGGHIQMRYGSCGIVEAVAGLTPGGVIPTPQVDLSAPGVTGHALTDPIFEVYTPQNGFDLHDDLLTFAFFSGQGYMVVN